MRVFGNLANACTAAAATAVVAALPFFGVGAVVTREANPLCWPPIVRYYALAGFASQWVGLMGALILGLTSARGIDKKTP